MLLAQFGAMHIKGGQKMPDDTTLDGYNASDFGADHITSEATDNGGTHYTAYSETGGQVSWDTDKNGEHVTGSEHLSDRNCGGKTWSSW